MNIYYDWLVSHLVAGLLLGTMLGFTLLVWRRASAAQCCMTVVLFFIALVALAPAQWSLWPEVSIPRLIPIEHPMPVAALNPMRTVRHVTTALPTPVASNAAVASTMPTLCFGIWAAGAVLVLLRALTGHWQWRRLWREAGDLPAPALMDVNPELQREMRRMRLNIRYSNVIGVPMIAGRNMLVPADWQDGTVEAKTAALEHELAHLRHGDSWQRWLITLATALHWPSPLVWLAARRLRLAQELRCDEAVLARDVCPHTYAELLVAAARRIGHRQALLSNVAACMARPSQLAVRLQRLTLNSTETKPVRARHTLVTLLLIAVAMQLPHIHVAAEVDPQQEKKASELRRAAARSYDFSQHPLGTTVQTLAHDAGIPWYGRQLVGTCDLKAMKSPFAALEQLLASHDLKLQLIDDVWVVCAKAEDPRSTWKPRVVGDVAAGLRAARAQQYDFNQAALNDLVRFLASDAKISFVSIPDESAMAKRAVTCKITGSPFSVLELVCRANGLSLNLDNDFWYISENGQLAVADQLRGAPSQRYDFAKANLGDVLRYLARDAGIDLLLPKDVKAAQTVVTFSLKASPLSAMEILCRTNGLKLAEEKGVWRVQENQNKP